MSKITTRDFTVKTLMQYLFNSSNRDIKIIETDEVSEIDSITYNREVLLLTKHVLKAINLGFVIIGTHRGKTLLNRIVIKSIEMDTAITFVGEFGKALRESKKSFSPTDFIDDNNLVYKRNDALILGCDDFFLSELLEDVSEDEDCLVIEVMEFVGLYGRDFHSLIHYIKRMMGINILVKSSVRKEIRQFVDYGFEVFRKDNDMGTDTYLLLKS